MSTTTQILFNSPALHSLKRDQLVKLCKIHSIKANGKNVELVERLKSHAKVCLGQPVERCHAQRAGRCTGGASEWRGKRRGGAAQAFNPRPSSQWEVVMDSITEEQEDSSSSQGSATISSLKSGNTTTTVPGEFGSTSSKSTSTVTSSIRALASSLGLKRHATNASTSSKLLASFPLPPLPRSTSTDPATDELLKHSTPYDALPPPRITSPSTPRTPAALAAAGLALASNLSNPTLNPTLGTAPLPGHTLRPGVPAPANARLSLGLAPRTPSKRGPTTTIRLVSSSALNADTTANTTAVPARALPPPGGTPNLKPFKTTFDLDMDIGSPTTAFPASSGSGSLYPALPAAFPAPPGALYPSLPASPPMDDAERRMSLEASTSMHAEDNNTQQDEDDDEPMPGAFAFAPTSTPSRIAAPAFVFGSPSPPAGGAPRFSFAMPVSPGADADAKAKEKARLAAEVMEEMNRRVFGFGATGTPTSPRVVRPLPGSARRGEGVAWNGGKKEGRFDKAHAEVFGRMESIADVAARKEGLLKRKASTSSIAGGGSGVGGQQGKRVRVEEGGAGPAATNAGNTETEAEAKQKEREKEAIRRKLEISRARRRSSAAGGGARRVSGRVSGAGVLGRFGFFAGAAKLVQGVWGGGKKASAAAPAAPKAVSAAATASSSTAGKSKHGSMGPPPAPPAIPDAPSTGASASTGKGLRPPSMRSVASTRSTAAGRARSPIPSAFAPAPASTASSKSTASSARTRNSSIAGSSVGTRTSSMGTRNSFLRVGSLGTRSSSGTPSSTVDSARSKNTGARPVLAAPCAHGELARQDGGERVAEKTLDTITNTAAPPPPPPGGTARGKGKLLPAPARKPRISRSRVIAKLASQRVASGSSAASASGGAGAGSAARKSLGGGRTRSSLGAKVQRGSFAGMKNAPGAMMVLDAKKRARQSEYYARRKSRGVESAAAPSAAADADAMQVDS
ncbi:hypothetical protein B0H14DRAFT_2633082 [Mycena olivaceomarginata]|nr:hypothetical protein B0H14DRAFT_2633082 [Mycena olivaceomarginata]